MFFIPFHRSNPYTSHLERENKKIEKHDHSHYCLRNSFLIQSFLQTITNGVVRLIHLQSLVAKEKSIGDTYPFTLPIFNQFKCLQFNKSVTIVVGENGTGKTTLLEAIASNAESILINGDDIDSDPTLKAARMLAQKLKLIWTSRTKNGFFFRGDRFYSFYRTDRGY